MTTLNPLISIIDPEGPAQWFSELENLGHVTFSPAAGRNGDEAVSSLVSRSTAVIITSATGIDADLMARSPHLRIVAKCGGAPSSVDLDAATRHGIAVSYVPQANSTTVAEYTVLLILGLLRRFDEQLQVVQRGGWRDADTLLGRDLRDATVGIIGYGSVGQQVVARLEPFGCALPIYSPSAQKVGMALPSCSAFVPSLENLLPRCDVVTLHCSATPENYHLFSKERFALMKQGACFVNTARGALVDEEALSQALHSGALAGAAVDVFTEEPPRPDHPLLHCPNLRATAHVAAWTTQALERECRGAVASVKAILTGSAVPGLLNPDFRRFLRSR